MRRHKNAVLWAIMLAMLLAWSLAILYGCGSMLNSERPNLLFRMGGKVAEGSFTPVSEPTP